MVSPKKPPPEKVEAPPRKPGAGVFWRDGHWAWDDGKAIFYWVDGGWIREREGWVFQPGGWEPHEKDGKRIGWRYIDATWVRESEIDRVPATPRRYN